MQLKLSYYQVDQPIEIILPTSDEELISFITRLPDNEPIQGYDVESFNEYLNDFTEYFDSVDDTDICEWNLLAKEFGKFDGSDELRLNLLLQKTNFTNNPSVAELINLSRNALNQTFIFADASDSIELFEVFAEQESLEDMLPRLKDIDYDSIDEYDAKAIGDEIVALQKGSFIDDSYIATDDYLINMYNGDFQSIDIDEQEVNENSFDMNM